MGWNDRMEEHIELSKFLNQILHHLDNTAKGITKLVIDKGQGILSDKQKFVFQRDVFDEYITVECERCGANIPWNEMYAAHHNGGYCDYCAYMDNKLEAE